MESGSWEAKAQFRTARRNTAWRDGAQGAGQPRRRPRPPARSPHAEGPSRAHTHRPARATPLPRQAPPPPDPAGRGGASSLPRSHWTALPAGPAPLSFRLVGRWIYPPPLHRLVFIPPRRARRRGAGSRRSGRRPLPSPAFIVPPVHCGIVAARPGSAPSSLPLPSSFSIPRSKMAAAAAPPAPSPPPPAPAGPRCPGSWPNFAVVCSFLERYGALLDLPELPFPELERVLQPPQEPGDQGKRVP